MHVIKPLFENSYELINHSLFGKDVDNKLKLINQTDTTDKGIFL